MMIPCEFLWRRKRRVSGQFTDGTGIGRKQRNGFTERTTPAGSKNNWLIWPQPGHGTDVDATAGSLSVSVNSPLPWHCTVTATGPPHRQQSKSRVRHVSCPTPFGITAYSCGGLTSP